MSSYLNENGPYLTFTDIVGYYRISVPIDTPDGPGVAEVHLPFGRPHSGPGTPPPDPYVETTTGGDLNLVEVIKNGFETQLGVTATVTKVTADAAEEAVTF